MEYISHSELDTKIIAKKVAEKLNNNDILVLTGELGAGKTKFMSGVAEYFNISDQVSSPTFTIVNEYNVPENTNNISNIYHFDVYKIQCSEDFENTIGLEYFENGLCIIEWGENIKDILPPHTIYINISKANKNAKDRIITISQEVTK